MLDILQSKKKKKRKKEKRKKMNNKHYQVFLMYRKKILENETTGEVSC